tara:strand:- start:102 stop:452 length:351 start_codon:yes stop_codon:yes gene_type:complete
MSKFVSFFNYLNKEFKNKDFDVLVFDPLTLELLVGIKSSLNAIFVKSSDKGILFYKREDECVVLGCTSLKTKNKFKQLLILTIDEKNGSILDNTKNKMDKSLIVETLQSWLIKDIA